MAKGHRMFAALWERMVRHEGPNERANREYVVGGSRGRVLEIGLGVGANWRYLPPEVTYVGIEPDPFMRERAGRHARESGRPFEIVDAGAERLPFEDKFLRDRHRDPCVLYDRGRSARARGDSPGAQTRR